MSYINTRNFQDCTKLPVTEFIKGHGIGSSLVIKTPDKGEVILELKQLNHALFGASSQTEKTTEDVIKKLILLEQDAKNFLLDKWLQDKQKDIER